MKRRVAVIMQPNFLGWCGYFDLIDQADIMIIDDLAALNTKSWQTRNRIRGRDGNTIWLTIPTLGGQGQQLNTVLIANGQPWQHKMVRTIHHAYSHAPHYPLLNDIAVHLDRRPAYLTSLTVQCLTSLIEAAGFDKPTPLVLASTLGHLRPGRIERLADMLTAVKATELLDTAGAKNVLNTDSIEDTPIRWHNYTPLPYSQGAQPWLPSLSVIDLIAWHGYGAADIIRTGRIPTH